MGVYLKKIKRLVFLVIQTCFCLILITYLFQKILTQDLSLEAISSKANLDFKAQSFSHRPGVYLASYADGPEVFFKNQNVLAHSALNKGIDFILNYRRSHLEPGFVKQHAAILNQKKGAGFWLWKPWVILNVLKSIPENAILIYSDTGLLFHKPINPLVELAKKEDIILFEYDINKYVADPIHIAKREIFIQLDCDTEKCHHGRHLWAGFAIFRNTYKSRAFVKKWLQFCTHEKLLIDELDPTIQQHPEFKRQYHDEAILNVLYNKDPKGKYLFPSQDLFENYATWHHRHPEDENHSLLPDLHRDQTSIITQFQNDFLNNYLTVTWRRLWPNF